MNKSHLSPAEAEALKTIEAAEAAGQDPFGDLDDDTTAAPAAAAASDASAAGATEQEDGEPAAGQEQAAGAEDGAAVDETVLAELADPLGIAQPAPTTYKAEIPADLDANREALLTEKADALEKLMAGEIDAKEFAAVEIRVTKEMAKIDRQLARAETLAEINQQSVSQYEGLVIAQIVDTTKSVLDYSKDATAARQFDAVMAGLRADPANASKSFADLAADANKAVLAIRGLSLPGEQAPAATSAPSASKPPQRGVPAVPPTLRGIPTAATPNSGGGVVEQMANLSGQAYEAAFSKLSPAQQAALLGE